MEINARNERFPGTALRYTASNSSSNVVFGAQLSVASSQSQVLFSSSCASHHCCEGINTHRSIFASEPS